MARNSQLCLNLSVPACIRVYFPRLSPASALNVETDQAVQTLFHAFGRTHGTEAEVDKAVELANGFDDVVVLLERPAMDHVYEQSFNDFVNGSPVLKGIDEVIRFVTRGRRSITDTSILDAFSFKPKGSRGGPSDHECHDLVVQILHVKRPYRILACCNEILDDHWLVKLKGCTPKYAPSLCQNMIQGRHVLTIRCFHPGYCINRCKTDPRLRMSLIMAFALAFTNLEHQRSALVSFARHIRPITYQSQPFSGYTDASCRLLRLLRQLKDIPGTSILLDKDKSGTRHLTREAQEEIFDHLWTLDLVRRTDCYFEAQEIRLIWREHYPRPSLQLMFSHELEELCCKQAFPSDLTLNLVEDMDNLTVSSSSHITHHIRRIGRTIPGTDRTVRNETDLIGRWKGAVASHIVDMRGQISRLGSLLLLDRISQHLEHVEVDQQISELGTECYDTIQSTLAMIAASEAHLCGDRGIDTDGADPHPRRALKDRLDAKTLVQGVLEDIFSLNSCVVALLNRIKEAETKLEIVLIPDPDDSTVHRSLFDAVENGAEMELATDVRSVIVALRLELAGVSGLLDGDDRLSVMHPVLPKEVGMKGLYQAAVQEMNRRNG